MVTKRTLHCLILRRIFFGQQNLSTDFFSVSKGMGWLWPSDTSLFLKCFFHSLIFYFVWPPNFFPFFPFNVFSLFIAIMQMRPLLRNIKCVYIQWPCFIEITFSIYAICIQWIQNILNDVVLPFLFSCACIRLQGCRSRIHSVHCACFKLLWYEAECMKSERKNTSVHNLMVLSMLLCAMCSTFNRLTFIEERKMKLHRKKRCELTHAGPNNCCAALNRF